MHHRTLPIFDEKGFVILRDYDGPAIPASEWQRLEYMDWKSGGDTNFAPLASALGEMECAGFWDHGKPDKDGIWTKNQEIAPSFVRYVEAVGARYGRVRVIKLNPSDEGYARQQLHLDDNNRLNPDGEGWVVRSWLELTDNNASFILREDKGDQATESVIPLHAGMQFIIDTQRLWHVVAHPGAQTRYALISSFTTGPNLDAWITAERA